MSATDTRRFGNERGEEFYLTALLYAQSLWLEGLPARAILLLNRAMGASLTGNEKAVRRHPVPYKAVAWILKNHREGDFIGNPRRHWQHLATRMSGPRPELRKWRAWACWALACEIMPDCPPDLKQIEEEGIVEPAIFLIETELEHRGMAGEAAEWKTAFRAE